MFLLPDSRARTRPRALGTPNNLGSATAYTLRTSDVNGWVEANSSSATTITIPADTIMKANLGDVINLVALNSGIVTIAAGSGVTLVSSGSKVKLTGQYSAGSIYKFAPNIWVLFGDLSS